MQSLHLVIRGMERKRGSFSRVRGVKAPGFFQIFVTTFRDWGAEAAFGPTAGF